jgi:ABC-type microcin C transport system permease subunit YejB
LEFLLFLVRRILWSLLVLVGLSMVIFAIARVVPGDPARMALGPTATQEQVSDLREKLGLNRPIVEQYGLFVAGLARGDLGRSLLTERPVNDDIREHLRGDVRAGARHHHHRVRARRAAGGCRSALEGPLARQRWCGSSRSSAR